MNVTLFVLKVWAGQYREELILNVTVFLVRVWGWQYREELLMNITEFVLSVWRRAIERGTDTECYCVCCEGLGRAI